MHDVFLELTSVIVLTVAVSLVMRWLKQPLILGYILAGIIVGPAVLNVIRYGELFESFSSVGIALLLFIIGLGMNVSELRKLGRSIIAVAAISLAVVGGLGFLVATWLGMTTTESLLIGLMLFFSSTIIIAKILTDKKEQGRLHAHITYGIILLEHIVATVALLFIATRKNGGLEAAEIGLLALKGIALVALLVFANTKVLTRLTRSIAASQELLFLFAIAWGFGIASLFQLAGLSLEEGALFAGVALASTPYAREIAARLKPLRDFFVVLFFITIGQALNFADLQASLMPALILSAIVVVVKPLVIMMSLGFFGYSKRVSFMAGINLSQISEFSIILVIITGSAGLVSPGVSALVTLVAMITIAASTYLMHYDNALFRYFEKFRISLFDRAIKHPEKRRQPGYQLLLFGYQKGGHEFINTFTHINKKYMVVDYDPSIIESLEHRGIPCLYGDATDPELMEEVNIENVKLVVSTFGDHVVSEQLVETIRRVNKKAVIVCHADNHQEAVRLYDLGATYVMMPHYIGTEQVSLFIKKNVLHADMFDQFREKHLNHINTYVAESAAL